MYIASMYSVHVPQQTQRYSAEVEYSQHLGNETAPLCSWYDNGYIQRYVHVYTCILMYIHVCAHLPLLENERD